jgi:hypothetical protein
LQIFIQEIDHTFQVCIGAELLTAVTRAVNQRVSDFIRTYHLAQRIGKVLALHRRDNAIRGTILDQERRVGRINLIRRVGSLDHIRHSLDGCANQL